MKNPASKISAKALTDLLDVSPQVQAALIADIDSEKNVACTPNLSEDYVDQLTQLSFKILEAADTSRQDLEREPISQIEIATQDGHVFVVSDTKLIITAVTDADPTVGLVFYDLKTSLRETRESTKIPD